MEDSENHESASQPSFIPEPPRKRRLIIPVVVILTLVVGSLMAVKHSFQKQARLNHDRVELVEGAELPDLDLVKLDDTKVQLSDLSHKVMMINFWATWCEACMEEMPSLVKLREEFAPKGFEILGINVDENPRPVATTAAVKLGIKFPLFTDAGNALSEIFDVHAIPLTVIINKDRKILMIEAGGRDWGSDEVRQLMEKWLKES